MDETNKITHLMCFTVQFTRYCNIQCQCPILMWMFFFTRDLEIQERLRFVYFASCKLIADGNSPFCLFVGLIGLPITPPYLSLLVLIFVAYASFLYIFIFLVYCICNMEIKFDWLIVVCLFVSHSVLFTEMVRLVEEAEEEGKPNKVFQR